MKGGRGIEGEKYERRERNMKGGRGIEGEKYIRRGGGFKGEKYKMKIIPNLC